MQTNKSLYVFCETQFTLTNGKDNI